MQKIIRTPTNATGGITKAERAAMEKHAALWTARAFRTDPINHQKITDAIVALYATANLEKPQVVVVPSPLVMAFAYGAAAALIAATHAVTRTATNAATHAATRAATNAATNAGVNLATRIATDEVTYASTHAAADAAVAIATRDATNTAAAVAVSALRNATAAATDAATRAATRGATAIATTIAVGTVIRNATVAIEDTARATYAATRSAVHLATRAATNRDLRVDTFRATYTAVNQVTNGNNDGTAVGVQDAAQAASSRAAASATRMSAQGAAYNNIAAATDYSTRIDARASTHDVASAAAYASTRNITEVATYAATQDAIIANDRTDIKDIPVLGAILACNELGGYNALVAASKWTEVYQGGNMWAPYECYLTAMRDIIGLQLPEHEKYLAWEMAAIEGGFRVLHEKFCLVSDFPEFIKIDDNNRPHCADGPSHRWRDGWSLYHWHGVAVPEHWIEFRDELSASEVLKEENLEKRRAGCEIVGWPKMLKQLESLTIDRDDDPEIGELLEVKLPDLSRPARFLRVRCGTGREFVIGVPPNIQTALDAQAWCVGLSPKDFRVPEVRT